MDKKSPAHHKYLGALYNINCKAAKIVLMCSEDFCLFKSPHLGKEEIKKDPTYVVRLPV